MSRATRAVENFLAGYACSQAVFAEYSELYSVDPQQALKISAGFAGGMRIGSTCGAVSAAYMILGLQFGTPHCEKAEGRKPVYNAMGEFTRRFAAANGALSCKLLLGCDISTGEGLRTAKERDLFKTTCPRFVRSAAELLDEILESG